ncbi:hypothetical protein K6Q96_10135 [Grimontia kaedaensis]|uniref:Lipoprotein n=1 Tax=Grimontia kaedaensis TaxID=2872157 RepID=A0ABY4WNZ1_9GAMM|nr:hypothetical protein [Grimontia kaedaensis]USH01284.1 hypothetical protein K6Q96_10135 [Grimontia kaedaensis]
MKQVLVAFASLFLFACTSKNSPNSNVVIFNRAIEERAYLLLAVYDGKVGKPSLTIIESKFKAVAGVLCEGGFSFDKPDNVALKKFNRMTLEKWIANQHINFVAKSPESGFSTQSTSSETKMAYCT